MIYPVSVVIPHMKSRDAFFHEVCLPSVEANHPAQIIVISRDGGACEKRNEGASKAMYPYILFVDDDTELLPDCLEHMVGMLEYHAQPQFCYSDRIVVDHLADPVMEDTVFAGDWNFERLKHENYIDTCSLIRRQAFPGFDPAIKRLQDWDLFLTIAKASGRGVYVQRRLCRRHHIDHGISDLVDLKESIQAVKLKHGLV